MVDKLFASLVVHIDGRPIRTTLVRVEEPEGMIPHVTIEWSSPTETIDPGAPVSVPLPDGTAFQGSVGEVDETRGPAGVSWVVRVYPDARKLDTQPACCFFTDKTRGESLDSLLSFGGLSIADPGAPNNQHARLTLLSEPRRPVATRLTLLGGRLLLFPLGNAIAIDPCAPSAVLPLPRFEIFHRKRRAVPSLTMVAPDPKQWAKVVRFEAKQPSIFSHTLHLPEAVAADELAAAAGAIQAVERMGQFQISGGAALAALGPGTWIQTPGGGAPLLITGRIREWTPGDGWHVTLLGGFPWDELSVPTTADTEACEVVGFNQQTGLLRVKLPGHDDLVIEAGMRADRASDSELNVNPPGVGDHGTVVFGAGCDHALYIGSVVPPGKLTKDQFDNDLSLLQTAKLTRRYRKDGAARLEAEQTDLIYRRQWNVHAKNIDFRRYSG